MCPYARFLHLNIIKHPMILVPPTIASAVVAPVMTTLFPMTNNAAGAGMGTSGLIGQIMTINTMGGSLQTWLLIIIFHIIFIASNLTAYHLTKNILVP